MLLIDDNGDLWEVDEADCELEADGSGFWYLAADAEESEDFYAFTDDEYVDADDIEA